MRIITNEGGLQFKFVLYILLLLLRLELIVSFSVLSSLYCHYYDYRYGYCVWFFIAAVLAFSMDDSHDGHSPCVEATRISTGSCR